MALRTGQPWLASCAQGPAGCSCEARPACSFSFSLIFSYPFDVCPKQAQLLVNALVPSIYLPNVADDTAPLSAQRCAKERHSCTYIRALELFPSKAGWPHDHSAVRIAEDDACSHGDQPVDKEQPSFVHFLPKENCALALCCHKQGNAHHVGGKSRPDTVIDLRDRAVWGWLYLELLIGRDKKVLPLHKCAHP